MAIYFPEHTKTILFVISGRSYFVYFYYREKSIKVHGLMLIDMLARTTMLTAIASKNAESWLMSL